MFLSFFVVIFYCFSCLVLARQQESGKASGFFRFAVVRYWNGTGRPSGDGNTEGGYDSDVCAGERDHRGEVG